MEKQKLWELESLKTARHFLRRPQTHRAVVRARQEASSSDLKSQIQRLQPPQTVMTSTTNLHMLLGRS